MNIMKRFTIVNDWVNQSHTQKTISKDQQNQSGGSEKHRFPSVLAPFHLVFQNVFLLFNRLIGFNEPKLLLAFGSTNTQVNAIGNNPQVLLNSVSLIETTNKNRSKNLEAVPDDLSFYRRGIQIEAPRKTKVAKPRNSKPLNRFHNRLLKRVFDIVFSLSVIVFV